MLRAIIIFLNLWIIGVASSNAATLVTLATFAQSEGPINGGLLLDDSGNLFGLASQANSTTFSDAGHVFKVSSTGEKFLLASFSGPDGRNPFGTLVRSATSGLMYGVTFQGGPNNTGAVFSFNGTTKDTVHNFRANPGSFNEYGPVFGNSDYLYGTSSYGGLYGNGAVYELRESGEFREIHSFSGSDGSGARSSLYFDGINTLYGVTAGGGDFGRGTVYKLRVLGGGGPVAFETLASFDGINGSNPLGNIVADKFGNFYGVTLQGGVNDRGSVFRLDQNGKLSTVHSFSNSDGIFPTSLTIDAAGNLFGVTSGGGDLPYGSIFKIGGDSAFSTLWSFNGDDGSNPFGPLLSDGKGGLYGTTAVGGTGGGFGGGTVFRLDDAGFATGSLPAVEGAPNDLELASMSGRAYTLGASTDGFSERFINVFNSSETQDGKAFFASVFREGSQIVVAFRGTFADAGFSDTGLIGDGRDFASASINLVKNILSNQSFVSDSPSDSLVALVTEATNFLKFVKSIYVEGTTFILTGHSLGGALAEIIGYHTGDRTVTFNAPGTGQLVDDFAPMLSAKLGAAADDRDITNYRQITDFVSLVGTPAGDIRTIVVPTVGADDDGDLLLFSQGLSSHRIGRVIDSLASAQANGLASVESGVQGPVWDIALLGRELINGIPKVA